MQQRKPAPAKAPPVGWRYMPLVAGDPAAADLRPTIGHQSASETLGNLPNYQRVSNDLGLQLVYTSRPPVPPAVEVFAEFLKEKMSEEWPST